MNILSNLITYRFHVMFAFLVILYDNLVQHNIPSPILYVTLFSFSLLHWAIYLYNKATDIEEDRANQKKENIQVKRKQGLQKASIVASVLPLPLLWFSPLLLLFYIGHALLGFGYSAKIRVKKQIVRGKQFFVVKNVYAAIGWAVPLVAIPVLLTTPALHDLYYFCLLFLVILIGEILWDVRDMKGDKKQHIQTIPNTLGLISTKYICFALLLLSLFLLDKFFPPWQVLGFFTVFSLFIFFAHPRRSRFYYHSIVIVLALLFIMQMVLKELAI